MDHQLDDSLSLDSAMGVDFGHSSDVVDGQASIILDSSRHIEEIPMEFGNNENQSMLVETENDETIGLMGEEFTLTAGTEYPLDKVSQASLTEAHHSDILSESMMDIPFETETLVSSTPTTSAQTQRVSIKIPRNAATFPRQVAIAPKPSPLMTKQMVISGGKQYTIAPKPVSLTAIPRPTGTVKKVTLAGVMQGQKSGQTLLAQIGKQLVMMPGGSTQKIKLVQASGQPIQAQLITTKNVVGAQGTKKPIMAKVVLQNQSGNSTDQSAVITKMTPTSGTSSGTPRFVTMQQKTVPISKVGKIIMGSPTNTGLRFTRPKQHIVSVKSSPSKILPAQKARTQKIIITNQHKNVVLKTTIPHKATQVIKSEPNTMTVSSGQSSQLHPVNGIQYIRLVTNPSSSSPKVSTASTVKPSGPVVNMPPKTILLADNKGNIIQMAADKMSGNQPPPLLVTSGGGQKVSASKPQQKLVRIAPVGAKTTQVSAANASSARPGQSLLAPMTASVSETPTSPTVEETWASRSHTDSKDALRALIESTVGDVTLSPVADAGDGNIGTHEVEVAYERQQRTAVDVSKKRKCSPDPEDNASSTQQAQQQMNWKVEEHPLIVIPSSYVNQQEQSFTNTGEKHFNDNNEQQQYIINEFINMNPEISSYQQSATPPPPDNDFDRPRKACNCTKSQCLKLYCDCFANGEFCNRCNCTNCYNNLENEELRQKAIRGCLDRNPNAFRPKIGKSRSGGPETVRRHNKGCNCKRSGCLKNYCECYEAKIACTAICKCVGCRNVEEALERLLRRREGAERRDQLDTTVYRPPPPQHLKQPCSFMTTEVIEAVCQCLIAAAAEGESSNESNKVPKIDDSDPVKSVIEEFARCLQDIISASHQGPALNAEEGAV